MASDFHFPRQVFPLFSLLRLPVAFVALILSLGQSPSTTAILGTAPLGTSVQDSSPPVSAPQTAASAEDSLDGYAVTFPAMGVKFRIAFYCRDEETAAAVEAEARRLLTELEQVFTDYDETSEALRLCQLPAGSRFPASYSFVQLLQISEETRRKTDGCFDVSIGQFTQLWRQMRRQHDPQQQAILQSRWEQLRAKRVETTQEDRFRFDAATLVFQRGSVDFGFDFGGIAKGYAADRILQHLESHFGIERAMVDASGDVTVHLPPPNQPGWQIGLSQLNPADGLLHTINLKQYSVASSGDARQFWQDDQQRKSHLIDPRNAQAIPGNHLTIVAHPSGAIADALASALSVCPDDQFQVILERYPQAEAIRFRVAESGQRQQQMSPGWADWLAQRERK